MCDFDLFISDCVFYSDFREDFPYDEPGEYWPSLNGDILVTDMTEQHIRNCMRMVGKDDPWYDYFQKELERRKED